MKYKRYILSFIFLLISFIYISTTNGVGSARIILNLLTFGGIYGLAAIGINIHFGWTGLLNFGHAAFMGIGAYTTILLIPHALGREGVVVENGLPLPIAVLLGMVAAALLGLLLGLPTLRLRGDYLAIVTIAAAEIFRLLVRDFEDLTGGVYGIIRFSDALQNMRPMSVTNIASNIGVSSSQLWVGIVTWISIIITLILLNRLQKSPWGRALRAVREDEDAVRALGKNAVWLKLQSFMLGASIGGLSGILLAFNYGTLQASTFVPILTFYIWAALILGGVGSLSGPVLGAVVFWVIISGTDTIAKFFFENANGQQLAGVRFIFIGLLIMLTMIFTPSGILGKKEELLLEIK
jgi:branched-chain amino acid transport system permease protein